MNTMITGGAGFLGSTLSRLLIALGHGVMIVDDFSTGFRENLPPDAKLVHADISTEEFWEQLPQVDTVFHLGAMVSVPQSISMPIRCHQINVEGLIRLLRYCRHKSVRRIVFASSAAVYGDSLSQSENSLCAPKSPYGLSKYAGEHMLRMAAEEFGLQWVAFRMFNVFGPRQSLASAYASVIPRFSAQAVLSKPLQIHGDGLQTRDFIYVEDVAEYYVRAMESAFTGVVNLGQGQSMSIKELANQVCERFPHLPAPEFTKSRAGDIRDSCADISILHRNFGKVLTPFPDALDRTIAYYQNSLQHV